MPAILIFSVKPVGRHFKSFLIQHDRHRPVLQPGVYGSVKKRLDLLRFCGCGDVPVFRLSAQDTVPHAAAHHIGLKSCLPDPVYNILSLLRHLYPDLLIHTTTLIPFPALPVHV